MLARNSVWFQSLVPTQGPTVRKDSDQSKKSDLPQKPCRSQKPDRPQYSRFPKEVQSPGLANSKTSHLQNLPRWCDRGSVPLFSEGAAPPSEIEKRYPTDRTARKAATQCVIQPATVNEWKISWKPNVFGLGSGHLRP